MQETIGTVSLKIERLKRHLRLLKDQQKLCAAYPEYQAKLASEEALVQLQLCQMIQFQEKLTQDALV